MSRIRRIRLPTGTRRMVALGILLATACDSPTGPSADFLAPVQTGDGWQTASLESVGLDPRPLRDLLNLIDDTGDHGIHSLLLVRGQELVFEKYWPGIDLVPESLTPIERNFDRETLHYVASVSKSLTSALAGIALDSGFLDSLDGQVFSYFPENEDLRTEEKNGITVRHLLSFTSGLHWNEFVYGFDDPRDSHNLMFNSEDPIRHLLARNMDSAPGHQFHYNSGDTNLLGEIVRKSSSSTTLIDYAEEHLFGPLGIVDYEWRRFGPSQTLTFASGGASLRPRDMAKLGALYLNGGVWNGVRVLPQEWVDESVEMAIPLVGNYRTLYGYGYNWWLGRSPYHGGELDYYRAAGWGEQNVWVYPEVDLIIISTAGAYYQSGPLDLTDLIEDYILAAIIE